MTHPKTKIIKGTVTQIVSRESRSFPYKDEIRKIFKKEIFNKSPLLSTKGVLDARLIGLTVEYLSKYLCGWDVQEAITTFKNNLVLLESMSQEHFEHYLQTAEKLNQEEDRQLSNDLISDFMNLSAYDRIYRAGAGVEAVVELQNSNKPSEEEFEYITQLINRSMEFLKKCEPMFKHPLKFRPETFKHCSHLSNADGDFYSDLTILDFKVTKYNGVYSDDCLQVLTYWLLQRLENNLSNSKFDKEIEYIMIFNPNYNALYTCKVEDVTEEMIDFICERIMGVDKNLIF
ncbi:hypothetical protein MHSWG343_10150 [Candidatus Mycoplasma haematohominis]|uniref:Uncharacterized protein n=1 Tax=Candidatus Mycoplasma haematohominis TaxID=1494318 RepID=A0A478FS22_9MOLU|nr:hypothetical protein MHSWG343_10150 [Candidatus Mycoplasma haemohominis]